MDTKAPLRSYLDAAKRKKILLEQGIDLAYAAEAQAADQAGDLETAWAWLAKVELPAPTLLNIKVRRGAQFIRDKKLNTTQADAKYGPDWLNQ